MTPEEIKSLRKRLGLSQEYFARLVGVSLNTVIQWENGRNPSHLAQQRLEEVRKSAMGKAE